MKSTQREREREREREWKKEYSSLKKMLVIITYHEEFTDYAIWSIP